MIALAIVFAILLLIALLRFGVSVEYSEDGILVIARIGMLSLRVFPRKIDLKKAERRAARKAARKARKKKKEKIELEEEPKAKKPGDLRTIIDLLLAVKTMLGRFKRKLLIKRLTIHFTAANEDPSKTAMTYGAASAGFSVIVPILERNFKIRRRDFLTNYDFSISKPLIYINAAVSIAVWEVIYIVFAIIPVLLRSSTKTKRKVERNHGKEGNEYGKSPN